MIEFYAYQWDTAYTVAVPWDEDSVPYMDFVRRWADDSRGTITPTLADGTLTAICPPELLTAPGSIIVWLRDENTRQQAATLIVQPRSKPDDYVYTEAERWTAEKAVTEAMEKALATGDFTGPKGDQGDPGPAPVRGTDYWTPEDVTAMESDVSEKVAAAVAGKAQLKPEFAQTIEDCTDTSKLYVLPDGYIYAYTSGGTQEVFTDVLKDVGYTENTRVNSSGALVAWTTNASDVTGYIPCKVGDVFRLKNMSMPYPFTSNSYWSYVAAYDAEKNFIKKYRINENGDDADAVLEDNNIVQFTLKPTTVDAGVAYVVINAQEITDASEVYVNSTFISTDAWTSTGHAFIPADYEDRIIALENEVGDMGGAIVPDYWQTELENKAETIRIAMEAAGRNKSAFLWYTDAHWTSSSKRSPAVLQYLAENTPINKVNFGGDIIGDPATYSHDTVKYAYEWRKMVSGLRNHHSVPGNHDLNHNSTDVRNMAYAFLLAPEESADMVCGDGLYYYIDSHAERTRYLYLDYMTNNHTAMTAQGQFIVDALNTAPDGWHIVAIAHRWFQYTSSSAPTVGSVPNYEKEILNIFDEYNARGKHTAS
ncbi:MAG: hypothetical protein IJY28_06355, partial [Clostridia bacterium]|nr:hypothetical protein [Clostridia bacterium]